MPLSTYWIGSRSHARPYSFAPWLWLVLCHGSSKKIGLSLALCYKFASSCGSQTNFLRLAQTQLWSLKVLVMSLTMMWHFEQLALKIY
jgi:hypothetical protein